MQLSVPGSIKDHTCVGETAMPTSVRKAVKLWLAGALDRMVDATDVGISLPCIRVNLSTSLFISCVGIYF